MNKILTILLVFLIDVSIYSQKSCYCFRQNGNKVLLYACSMNDGKTDTFPDFNFRVSFKKNVLDTRYYSLSGDTLNVVMSKTPDVKKVVNVAHGFKDDIYIEGTFREVLSKDLPNGLLAKFRIRRTRIKFVVLKYDNAVFEFVKKRPINQTISRWL
jgi:hypothetical protein